MQQSLLNLTREEALERYTDIRIRIRERLEPLAPLRALICKTTIFAMLSSLFVGCAVEGHSYERAAVAPAKSAVYVYRPYNVFGSVVEDPVSCGDQSMSLGPGGYHRLVVDPGHLRCSAHTEVTNAVEFDAKAGESYYIRESLGPGVIVPHVHLDLTSSDEAEDEIRGCAEQ